MGACNTQLRRYFEDLSRSILETPKILKFQLVNQKNKYAFVQWLQIRVVKRTAMGKRVRFFFTMFSTSEVTKHIPQNRVNDTITHMALNIMNGVVQRRSSSRRRSKLSHLSKIHTNHSVDMTKHLLFLKFLSISCCYRENLTYFVAITDCYKVPKNTN